VRLLAGVVLAAGNRKGYLERQAGLAGMAKYEGFMDISMQDYARPFRLYSLKAKPEFVLLPLRASPLRAQILNGSAFQYKGPAGFETISIPLLKFFPASSSAFVRGPPVGGGTPKNLMNGIVVTVSRRTTTVFSDKVSKRRRCSGWITK
jgi:hypothetical protein